MTDINETIAEVLRLDAQATQGPWEPFAGSVVREGETAYLVHGGPDTDAALVAYYRTAAPALAREVQRLQAEIQPRIERSIAFQEAMEEAEAERDTAYRRGQEAMRERCASSAARDADGACNCGRPICQPDCARVRLLDLADAIRALEVSDD